MKLGCASWCFTAPHYQAPYEPAIRTVGELGFQAIEMIAHNEKDVKVYYTAEKIKELRKLINSYHMEISEFAFYTQITQGLASLDDIVREEAFLKFEEMVKIGYELGTDMINMVSNWVYGHECPVDYVPNYWSPHVEGVPYQELTQNMTYPNEIDWNEVWKRYMDTIKRCLEICRKYKMRFNVEGHANVIVGNSDAMLRMFDYISDEDLGINLDTAWHMIQREYVPMVVEKLGARIFHVHMRDGDGMINYNLPPGKGINNWEDTLKALKRTGYDGVLSFEMAGFVHADQVIAHSKRYIESILEKL